VVIDEGSQMPLIHSLIPILLLGEKSRLLVAGALPSRQDSFMGFSRFSSCPALVLGDHWQLPPIVKGKYPLTEPILFGSILQFSIGDVVTPDQAKRGFASYVVPLEENLRMEPDLAAFTRGLYEAILVLVARLIMSSPQDLWPEI